MRGTLRTVIRVSYSNDMLGYFPLSSAPTKGRKQRVNITYCTIEGLYYKFPDVVDYMLCVNVS